jgi:hypothetical protein
MTDPSGQLVVVAWNVSDEEWLTLETMRIPTEYGAWRQLAYATIVT